MSKHWKRFAAVVVSLTMAFQFCVNDFYAYAETTTPEQETVEQTPTEQQTQPEPEVTTEPVETPAQTEPAQEPAPEVETETTTPPEQEQPQQPAQEQTPAQPEREVAGTLKLEFKDEEGNTLKTVDPIALTDKVVGDTIRLTDLGVDTNVTDYTLVDIKDKNDGTKDYNPNSVDFTLTKNITELQLVYRANPKKPETAPTENDTNTTEDSQQGEGEEDSEADADEADTEEEDSEEPVEEEPKEEEESTEEKEEKTYEIYILHSLSTNIGEFQEYESLTLKDSDFVDGKYDLADSILHEMRGEIYNMQTLQTYAPTLPATRNARARYGNSESEPLLRAADVLANRILHECRHGDTWSLLDKNNLFILNLP